MVKILVGTGVSWEGDGAFPSLANFHLWGAHGPSLKVFYACFIFVFLHCRTMFGREPMFTKFLLSSQTAIHTIKKLKIIISYMKCGASFRIHAFLPILVVYKRHSFSNGQTQHFPGFAD
jgi:hypothetical protein